MTGPNRPDRWRIDMTEQEQLRQLKEEYENMIIPETGRERLQAGIDRARMEKKEQSTPEGVLHGRQWRRQLS